MAYRRWWLAAVAAAAVALALLVAFRAPLGRALAGAALRAFTGYEVSFGALDIGPSGLDARDVRVHRDGDLVLEAQRLALAYDLRDLLPGGTRRYGLRSVSLQAPHFTLTRRADGSFDIPLGGGGGGGPGGSSTGATPLVLRADVSDGSFVLNDPYRHDPAARRIALQRIEVHAAIDTATRTTYRASAALEGRWPLQARGTIDAARGYAQHRLQAAALPIAALLNYVINLPGAHVGGGELRDLDVRAYAFGDGPTHLSGAALLSGGSITIPGLHAPLEGLAARFGLFDGGVASSRIDATFLGRPLHAAGGIYDWNAPAFRLGVSTSGGLETLREAFRFSSRLPLSGDLAVAALVEGAVGDPLVLVRFSSRHAAYAALPIDGAAGSIAYYDSGADLLGVGASYGPVAVGAHGSLALGDTALSELVIDARAPPGTLPYLAQAAPGAPLHATGVVSGSDLAVDARGVIDGSGGGDRIAGLFDVDRRGDGVIGPLSVERADGSSLAGSFYMNRIASESGFWLDAERYRLVASPHPPQLPGLPELTPPNVGGRIDASLAGDGPPSAFRLAGRVAARGLQIGNLAIDDVSAAVAGAPTDLRMQRVAADGPWGRFGGAGDYANGRLLLAGRYRGNLTELETFTGKLGATGSVDGPVALALDGSRVLVQARDIAAPGARVRGVPVERLDGTVGVHAGRIRIFAATALVAGGTLAAAGTVGGTSGAGVSLAGANAQRLRAAGSPLANGTLGLRGRVGYEDGRARFDGGVAISSAHYERVALAGNSRVHLNGPALALDDGQTLLEEQYATLAGHVDGFGADRLRYALAASVPAARVAPFARLVAPSRHDIAGTLAGDLEVSGAGASPVVSARLRLPEGTVNGLAFRDAHANVVAGRQGLTAGDGAVLVGTTESAFSGSLHGDDASLHVAMPHADLSDFDNWFDEGDALDGRGRIDALFVRSGRAVDTNAVIALANLRYRNVRLGDSDAQWSSEGREVKGQLSFASDTGRLNADGTLRLATWAPLGKLVARSRFTGVASLRDFDINSWLTVLGYSLPVTGRVDADARITGSMSDPQVATTATVVNATYGKIAIDKVTVSATSSLTRATVTSADLQLPSLDVTGSGSFGYGPNDPLALALHAKTTNIGALTTRLTGAKLAVTGSAEVDVKVTGPRSKPDVVGGFDIENATLQGVLVPQALGELSLQGRNVVLDSGELSFAKGTLYLAGSIPFRIDPFGFGDSNAPLTLDLTSRAVDLTSFAPLLPEGSRLEGVVDGRVGIDGTVGRPRVTGDLTLVNGALTAPFETEPLTKIGAEVSFAEREATLRRFHAEAGGGTLDATGATSLGLDVNARIDARATRLVLNLPAYGRGQIDGTLSLARTPGTRPKISGKLSLQDAVIPFSALVSNDAGGSAPSLGGSFPGLPAAGPVAVPLPAAPDVDLALDVTAGNNVRVRSGNIDIGGRGELAIGGSLRDPQLSGQFDSSGGTLAYFNTVFRVQSGTVTFSPDAGLIPTLDATATTHVNNPDPNNVRNPLGTADVTIGVKGPVNNLNITLTSSPQYSREQILGLLLNAPALGATNLFDPQSNSLTPVGQLPAGSVNHTASGDVLTQQAFSIANAQFTRNLLAPVETQFASALGLSNVNVNIDYTGGVGLSARKILGKNFYAIAASTFGYPSRQSFGFELKPNQYTAAQVTVFTTTGAATLGIAYPTLYNTSELQRIDASQPTTGQAGFSATLQLLLR